MSGSVYGESECAPATILGIPVTFRATKHGIRASTSPLLTDPALCGAPSRRELLPMLSLAIAVAKADRRLPNPVEAVHAVNTGLLFVKR